MGTNFIKISFPTPFKVPRTTLSYFETLVKRFIDLTG